MSGSDGAGHPAPAPHDHDPASPQNPALSSSAAPAEVLLRQLLADAPDRIYFKDLEGRFTAVSASKAARRGRKPSEMLGRTEAEVFGVDHASRTAEDDRVVLQTGVPILNRLEKETLGDGRVCWVMVTKMPVRDNAGRIIGSYGISRDVSEAVEAQRALEQTSSQLSEATRQAGMAEVATGVLHNVGNVLTSINVTANLLVDRLRNSKMTSLFKVSSLLKEHEKDLPSFFANDPRGPKLTAYLDNLSTNLEKDRQESMVELATLLKSVGHVKDIIWMQQSYASVSGIVEPLQLAETIEDALKLSTTALVRHNVQVQREFNASLPARAERHKVLQILVNLISNAKKAMDCKEPSQRRLVIRAEPSVGDTVSISVTDNGIGIPAENLTKIFSHGFTTRKDGHGFGLHSSAIAAKQMGGTLSAFSEGPGKGATFTLALPCWKDALPSPAHASSAEIDLVNL